MTLPLPHLVQRSRLMKLAIGASGFSPKRLSVAASIVRRWRQLMQRTDRHAGPWSTPYATQNTTSKDRPVMAAIRVYKPGTLPEISSVAGGTFDRIPA